MSDKDTLTARLWTLKYLLGERTGAAKDLSSVIAVTSSPEMMREMNADLQVLNEQISEYKAEIAEIQDQLDKLG